MRHNRSYASAAALFVSLAVSSLSLGGCKDENAGNTTKVEATATPVTEIAKSGDITKLEAPAKIVAFGGSNDPSAMWRAASSMGIPLGKSDLGTELAKAANLSDPTVIDSSKPMRFAIMSQGKKEPSPIMVLTVTSAEAFKKALPKDHKKDVEGNAYSVVNGSRTVYINLIDKNVIFTDQPKTFAEQKAFFAKLIGSDVTGTGQMVLDIQNIKKEYKEEIDKSFDDMKKGVEAGNPGAKQASGIFDLMKDLVEEGDKVAFSLREAEDGLAVAINASAEEGSTLKKHLSELKALTPAMFAKLPANAAFAMAYSVDPESSGWVREMSGWAMKMMLSGQAQAEFKTFMDDYWAGIDGHLAMAAYPNAKDELAMVTLSGVRDADKMKATMTKARELYKDPEFTAQYDKLGLKYDLKENAYKVGDVSVSTLAMSPTGKPGTAGAAGPMGMLMKLMNSHTAVGPKMVVQAFGPNAKDTVTAWLGDKVSGGFDSSPTMARAQKHAAKGLFGMALLRPAEVLKRIDAIKASPLAGQLTKQTSTNAVAFSFGASKGGLEIVIDLPKDQAQLIGSGLAMMSMLGR